MGVLRGRATALLIVATLTCARAWGQERYYRSNALGMAYEPVVTLGDSSADYVLGVRRGEMSVVKRLIFKGTEAKRWEQTFSGSGLRREEKQFTEGELVRRAIYNAEGLVAEEEEYEGGDVSGRSIYRYEARRLVLLEVFDGTGTSLYRETYRYTPAGLLREAVKSLPNGDRYIYMYNFGDGGLSEERIHQNRYSFVFRYDAGGRLVLWESWRDGDALEIEEREYHEQSGSLEKLVKRNLQTGTYVIRHFDEAGSVVREWQNGEIEIGYVRNESGDLIRQTKIGPLGKEEWVYEYDSARELKKEAYFRRGTLEKRRIYTGEDMWYEEIYREGNIFLKVYYSKKEMVREEFIQNGRVITERIHQN